MADAENKPKLSSLDWLAAKTAAAAERAKNQAEPVAVPEKPADPELDEKKPLDFFVANFVNCAIKDDQATMEAPMFSLSTKQDMALWTWESSDGKKRVEVAPGFYGRATLHDKDILIYCISQIIAAINAGKQPSRVVRFTAYDYLTSTNRSTGGDDYDRMKDALNRLKGTQITTNISTGKTRQAKGFGFINGWEIIEKSQKNDRMVAVEVELSRWIYRAIEAKEVLTINPDYFKLRKPLERRLYEIARKHVGQQENWTISVKALHDKCGSTEVALNNWRTKLKKIIQADALPDFTMNLDVGDIVRFTPKPKD